jgi:hypothetical protein
MLCLLLSARTAAHYQGRLSMSISIVHSTSIFSSSSSSSGLEEQRVLTIVTAVTVVIFLKQSRVLFQSRAEQ